MNLVHAIIDYEYRLHRWAYIVSNNKRMGIGRIHIMSERYFST